MQVTGIGGLFFRSRDPEARAAWYRNFLGIDAGHDQVWHQDAGMTVFAPSPLTATTSRPTNRSCSISASRIWTTW